MEQKISRYIAENIYKDLSLESAADALYLSPGYLSKTFKNVFGMHFTDYVVKAKMEEAVKLLRRNTQTVKEISNSLGYSSVQYFIRIFKERYGYTPKLYQKSLLEQESCHT